MNTSDLYKSNIIEHYKAPRHTEPIEGATHSVDVMNSTCGDDIHLDVEIRDGVFQKLSHQSRGCAISVASMSLLSDMILGKTIEEVRKINKEDIFNMVGMEPTSGRIKCALLSYDALQKVLAQVDEEGFAC